MENEEQLAGAGNEQQQPESTEGSTPNQQPVAPFQRPRPRPQEPAWMPTRDPRTAALLSIGRYRPAQPVGRPRVESRPTVYSQLGKRPAPQFTQTRRSAERPARRSVSGRRLLLDDVRPMGDLT